MKVHAAEPGCAAPLCMCMVFAMLCDCALLCHGAGALLAVQLHRTRRPLTLSQHPTPTRQAGNSAARLLGLTPAARVLPVEPDEPHIAAAKDAARARAQLQGALRARRAAARRPVRLV